MEYPHISIVIPCYNGANFIVDTLQSVFEQDYTNYELILIDDGSNDDSKEKIFSFNDKRLHYFYQQNKGVSAARNYGLVIARGEYIVFFDADDKMTSSFLSSRLNYLKHNTLCEAVCGNVYHFQNNVIIKNSLKGASSNASNEILLYNPQINTCPSNYLFKTCSIRNSQILFNVNLSSTADKFFLLQFSKVAKISYDPHSTALLYRVDVNSMSHKLSKKLVDDNELYYSELLRHDLIPKEIKKNALFLGYFILFGSYFKIKALKKSLRYAFLAFFRNPLLFIRKLL